MKFLQQCRKYGAALAVSTVVTVPVFAATSTPIDTANAVAQIGEINTAVAAVGAALVAAAAIAVGFKWLKGAIFS